MSLGSANQKYAILTEQTSLFACSDWAQPWKTSFKADGFQSWWPSARRSTFDETGYDIIIVRMSRVELRWKSPHKDCNNRL